MADGKELKPKSFRIDDETAERFKEISNTIGGNQQAALAKLIETYEMQAGKASLPDRKGDIEQFETHISEITRMYMDSLKNEQNAKEIARMEFKAQLESKDSTIQNLNKDLDEAREQRELAIADEKQRTDECSRLKSELTAVAEKVKDLQTALLDKDNLNKALTDSCSDLKAKAESMKKEAAQAEKLQEEVERLQAENAGLKQSMATQKEQAQIEMEKALLKQEKDFQRRLSEETDRYSKKLFDLLGKLPAGKPTEGSQAEKEAAGKEVEKN